MPRGSTSPRRHDGESSSSTQASASRDGHPPRAAAARSRYGSAPVAELAARARSLARVIHADARRAGGRADAVVGNAATPRGACGASWRTVTGATQCRDAAGGGTSTVRRRRHERAHRASGRPGSSSRSRRWKRSRVRRAVGRRRAVHDRRRVAPVVPEPTAVRTRRTSRRLQRARRRLAQVLGRHRVRCVLEGVARPARDLRGSMPGRLEPDDWGALWDEVRGSGCR